MKQAFGLLLTVGVLIHSQTVGAQGIIGDFPLPELEASMHRSQMASDHVDLIDRLMSCDRLAGDAFIRGDDEGCIRICRTGERILSQASEETTKLRSFKAKLNSRLGTCFSDQGRFEKSAKHYKIAVRLREPLPDPFTNDGTIYAQEFDLFYLMDSELKAGNRKEALRTQEKLRQLPDYSRALRHSVLARDLVKEYNLPPF